MTAPSGTDVKMSVTGQPVLVSDGGISAEEAKKGGASAMVFLPAGEAYFTAVPGTAAGKVTSLTAKPSVADDPFKAFYDKSPACRDQFGAVDFGLNPDVKAKNGKPLLSWLPQGMVAVLFGGNTWAGGTNECSFDGGGFLPGATVMVDGSPLVEKGTLTAQK